MEASQKMEYRTLGGSGIKVSRLSYGNWVNCKDGAQEKANELVKKAWELGINYFDTAEGYDLGEGERQLGIALKNLNVPRSDYVVSTKIFFGKFAENTNGMNNWGTSRKRLTEGLNRSLKNLDMEYVDIVFCHRYDEETPTLEVVQAMKDIINSGKAFYWAVSTWPALRVMEAMLLCDMHGCPRPIAEQCEYSMLVRERVEQDYCILFDDYKLGTTIWSPLTSGILTGKYNEGIPEGSRFAVEKRWIYIYDKYFSEEKKEGTVKMLQELGKIAEELGCSQAQLALAWCLVSKDVTTMILGASRPAQLEENFACLDVLDKLTPEVLERIEGVLGNRPKPDMDYRNMKQMKNRR